MPTQFLGHSPRQLPHAERQRDGLGAAAQGSRAFVEAGLVQRRSRPPSGSSCWRGAGGAAYTGRGPLSRSRGHISPTHLRDHRVRYAHHVERRLRSRRAAVSTIQGAARRAARRLLTGGTSGASCAALISGMASLSSQFDCRCCVGPSVMVLRRRLASSLVAET